MSRLITYVGSEQGERRLPARDICLLEIQMIGGTVSTSWVPARRKHHGIGTAASVARVLRFPRVTDLHVRLFTKPQDRVVRHDADYPVPNSVGETVAR
jgi:hypothetical protein